MQCCFPLPFWDGPSVTQSLWFGLKDRDVKLLLQSPQQLLPAARSLFSPRLPPPLPTL